MPVGRWDVQAFSGVRRGAFLDSIDGFDAAFFGIPPREALRLDPQQRLLLEVTWEALENAGIAPDSLDGTSTGVYTGVMGNDYALRQAHSLTADRIDPYMLTGNEASFAAGRLAYQLGLQGPAMAVATACSSSLGHAASGIPGVARGRVRSRACGRGHCDRPVTGVMLSQVRALSPDGRCKSFDAAADGYGRGEGCGMLVLERLSDAARPRAAHLAVIRGSAVNHDGASAGLTVPNGPAQEKLLRKAFEAAGIAGGDLDYVEAHGTGTSLGDPIEIRSLARARRPGAPAI